MNGIVKSWNPERGFGWIRTSDGRQFFLHITNYDRCGRGIPKVDQAIQFELGENVRTGKIQAVHAQPVPVDHAVGAQTLLHSPIEVTTLADGTEVKRVVL